MNLGEIKEALTRAAMIVGPNTVVPNGFCEPHSWRGIYAEAAFEPAGSVSLASMLADVERALTEIFSGYKGGDFHYNPSTQAHLSTYGDANDEHGESLRARVQGVVADAIMIGSGSIVDSSPATAAEIAEAVAKQQLALAIARLRDTVDSEYYNDRDYIETPMRVDILALLNAHDALVAQVEDMTETIEELRETI